MHFQRKWRGRRRKEKWESDSPLISFDISLQVYRSIVPTKKEGESHVRYIRRFGWRGLFCSLSGTHPFSGPKLTFQPRFPTLFFPLSRRVAQYEYSKRKTKGPLKGGWWAGRRRRRERHPFQLGTRSWWHKKRREEEEGV